MKKNLSTQGRLLRLGIAIILFGLAWFYWSWILLGFGLFTLYEAVASWCILYQIFGINSCSIK